MGMGNGLPHVEVSEKKTGEDSAVPVGTGLVLPDTDGDSRFTIRMTGATRRKLRSIMDEYGITSLTEGIALAVSLVHKNLHDLTEIGVSRRKRRLRSEE